MALPLFDFSFGGGDSGHGSWFLCALLIMLAWGLQAYFMKSANRTMSAESIFFYMAVTGLMLAPVAMTMTDWSKPINMGADGPWLAAGIQVLNAIGALTLVFAFRHGKAIVVSPLTNAGAPLLTAVISLAALGVVPAPLKIIGLVLATVAAILLAVTPEEQTVEIATH
jgi:drug/metabolite transporter (DMT)-like permease